MSTYTPKISVIIPIYNVAPYMERCARSLFEQTLDDIEYLFIDDCSPDDSIAILKKVLEEYPNRQHQVQILLMSTNSGQAAVRKLGVKKATGEYIVSCDSDDWIDVTMYQKLYDFAKKGDFDMVWCDYYISDGNSNRTVSQKCQEEKIPLLKSYLAGSRTGISGSICNKLCKRSIVLQNVIFPEADMTEDFVLSVQYVLNSSKIGYLPEALYYYCRNNYSITNNCNADKVLKRFNDCVDNFNLVLQIINNNGIAQELASEIRFIRDFA
jgi:glycosyltransferase involved in cell wall biosynthesis